MREPSVSISLAMFLFEHHDDHILAVASDLLAINSHKFDDARRPPIDVKNEWTRADGGNENVAR